jgi:regulator of sirC expression with transglutaminase-like and TPR domain
MAALREQARELEKQAERLRRLAQTVHQQSVLKELTRAIAGKEENIDLVHAALLIARLDNDELDVESYRTEIERMAKKVQTKLDKDAGEKEKLAALNKFLFEERGFHGSRTDYYHKSNSYLSEVIDDREGLPITLSLLYMELGGRLGLKIEGVGLPGHFVVRHRPAKGEPQLIDVFDRGAFMTREEASKKVEAITGEPLTDEDLKAVPKKAILTRMLRNLMRLAREDKDPASMLRYLDAVLTITPSSGEDRIGRAVLRAQNGDRDGALSDLDWIIENKPAGLDLDKVREFRERLGRPQR